MNFSDPFGLCPYTGKRDTNVDDCPKNALGNAFRLLAAHGGAEGEEAIETVAFQKTKIRLLGGMQLGMECGNLDSRGCSSADGKEIILSKSTSSSDMAVRLTHETTHILFQFPDEANGSQSRIEEGLAWDRALRVYSRLRPYTGQSTFYEPYYQAACDQHIGTACGQ